MTRTTGRGCWCFPGTSGTGRWSWCWGLGMKRSRCCGRRRRAHRGCCYGDRERSRRRMGRGGRPARGGDVARQLVQQGVIDLEKFKAAAKGSGSPLTPEQLKVLSEGSDDPLRIDANSAYFALDVLWALGLANKNTMLTQGPMAQYGWDKAGGYASTGGWTIGAKPGPGDLATLEMIRLTPHTQA